MADRRRGFSLVELVVVLAIFAILMALIIPAVQQARESANRAVCGNNLKQIGLAFHEYEVVHKTFPPNRIPCGPTWAVLILPYLEQDDLYRVWDVDLAYEEQVPVARETVVAGYYCPSRRDAHTAPGLSISGDEKMVDDGLGIQVRGALGDYAYNLGASKKDTEEDVVGYFASGDDLVMVPKLLGVEQASANAALKGIGLKMEASGDAEVGEVINQSPLPGTMVERGATVKALFAIRAPKLLDMREARASKILKRRRLNMKSSGDTEVGEVIEQFPLPGTVVERGATVELSFALMVPFLKFPQEAFGFTLPVANAILEDVTLHLRASGEVRDPRSRVVSQSPPPRTVVARGTIVSARFEIPPEAAGVLQGVLQADGRPLKRKKLHGGCSAAEPTASGPNGDGVALRVVDITDGLSNTLLVGEKHVPLGSFGRGGWDCSLYDGNTFSCASRMAGTSFPLAASIRDRGWKFGSYHPNLCQFVFADGSVHALSAGLNPVILGRLANPSDGQPIPPFE